MYYGYYGNCHHRVITLSKCGHLTNTSDFWGCWEDPRTSAGRLNLILQQFVTHPISILFFAHPSRCPLSLLPPKLYEVQSGICLKRSKDEDWNPKHPLKERKKWRAYITPNVERNRILHLDPRRMPLWSRHSFLTPSALCPAKRKFRAGRPRKRHKRTMASKVSMPFAGWRCFHMWSIVTALFFEWMASQIQNKGCLHFWRSEVGGLPSVTWDVQTNENTMTVGKCWDWQLGSSLVRRL